MNNLMPKELTQERKFKGFIPLALILVMTITLIFGMSFFTRLLPFLNAVAVIIVIGIVEIIAFFPVRAKPIYKHIISLIRYWTERKIYQC